MPIALGQLFIHPYRTFI